MPPALQPPGAGLPWPEYVLSRYVLLPLASRKLDWAQAGRLFQREGQRVLDLFDALRAGQGGLDLFAAGRAGRRTERVLVARLRGLEDSSRHWSAAMTVEHLHIVGTGILAAIASLRAGNVPPGQASTADVKPRGEEAPEETRAKFVGLLADGAAADALPPMRPGVGPRYPHPWFGPLDAHRWHVLNGIHQGIHRKQLEAIRAGLG